MGGCGWVQQSWHQRSLSAFTPIVSPISSHRRCSDTKVPLIKVQGFRCRMCLTDRDNKDRKK